MYTYKIYDENVSYDTRLGYLADMSSPGLYLSYDAAMREVLSYVPSGPYLAVGMISSFDNDRCDVWFNLHTHEPIKYYPN